MKYHRLSADLSVAPQLQLDDLAALREAGFRSIICNRPDGEGAEQPSFHQVQSEARRLGMQARYLPVVPEAIDNGSVLAFDAILAELPGPTLGYCRSGKRAATLWALSQAGKRPASELLAIAASAGYDLSGLAAIALAQDLS